MKGDFSGIEHRNRLSNNVKLDLLQMCVPSRQSKQRYFLHQNTNDKEETNGKLHEQKHSEKSARCLVQFILILRRSSNIKA